LALGDFETTERLATETIELSQREGRRGIEAHCRVHRARSRALRGELDPAEAELVELLAEYADAPIAKGAISLVLGQIARARGDEVRALGAFATGLDGFFEIGEP
jgi:hypothetical protein